MAEQWIEQWTPLAPPCCSCCWFPCFISCSISISSCSFLQKIHTWKITVCVEPILYFYQRFSSSISFFSSSIWLILHFTSYLNRKWKMRGTSYTILKWYNFVSKIVLIYCELLRSLEHFIQKVKSQTNFWSRMLFWLVPGGFS